MELESPVVQDRYLLQLVRLLSCPLSSLIVVLDLLIHYLMSVLELLECILHSYSVLIGKRSFLCESLFCLLF